MKKFDKVIGIRVDTGEKEILENVTEYDLNELPLGFYGIPPESKQSSYSNIDNERYIDDNEVYDDIESTCRIYRKEQGYDE